MSHPTARRGIDWRKTKDELIAELEALRSRIPIDSNKPKMKGEWLVRDIRKINREIPIILCTGYSRTISPETGAAIGIDKFMYKPVGPNDLCRVIRELLDASTR